MNEPAIDKMPLSIDISISLCKGRSTAANAVIDRSLVRLLLAVRETNSMQAACEKLCITPRQAQRTLKRFTDGSGIKPLVYHGQQGTSLSEQGIRCIEIYAEARRLAASLVRDSGIMQMPSDLHLHSQEGKAAP